ncbi:ArsR family transcriptional regulator [Halomarina halobia]|uniref:ArsR family transcriptional regulator n=1 Tax=Halomarina halobia TaxID=3033386 RepID=A0ABD6AA51_9EURY|nr:ArsR family transcriptional regulator [Halomarina sp. PSR21]
MTGSERASADAPDPSEAFRPLGNEVRTRTLAALLEPEEGEGAGVAPATKTFSELFEASGAETTAGFAYHLRQLTDHYLQETDDGYTFTYAGLQVARAIVSGAYTESVDREPVEIPDPCPLCDEAGLHAAATDNTVSVSCHGCGRDVLALPFPPGGHRTNDDESLPAAFDRLHRHRVALLVGGTCPECGGRATARAEYADREGDATDAADAADAATSPRPPRLHLACTACGYALRCPVTLAVFDHPAVVAFYYDHGIDLRERPIWNVGREWREAVLSADPWCVRVSTELEGETLELLVGRDGTVVAAERHSASESAPAAPSTAR